MEESQSLNYRCLVRPSTLLVDKVQFLAFLAHVINCSAQTERRTDRIRIIVGAASHLDMAEVTIEEVTRILQEGTVQPSQESE